MRRCGHLPECVFDTLFVFSLIAIALVFLGVVGCAHVGFKPGIGSNRLYGFLYRRESRFFVRSRPSARPEDVGFARRETRRASFAALFFGRTTSKSGRCARVLVAVGLFSSALEISLEPGVKGRGSRVPFPQKKMGVRPNLTRCAKCFFPNNT